MERYKTLSDYSAEPHGKLRVGGEWDAWCTRCHLSLSHTVLAMSEGEPARVMCNTCKSVHNYRTDPATRKTGARRTRATPSPRQPSQARQSPNLWEEAVRGKNLQSPIPYDPHRTFSLGEVILHGSFGIGVVTGIKDGGKMYATFQDDTHLLVHGR